MINEIYKILNDNFFDTDVMKNIRSIVDGIEVRNDRAIQKIWKEVNQQKDIVDKKKKRYSEFLFQIHRREIEKIVDYKQLVLEIDNEFNTKKISTEIIKNEDSDMRKVLEKAEFKVLVLVGDVYQIESIYFGNWFEIARNFISSESVFELIHPYRTQNKNKMSSGEKLPLCFYK